VSGRAIRFSALVATAAAIVLLASVAAYWTWQALAPRPVHIAPSAPADPAAAILASGLLATPGTAPATAPAPPEATLSGDTKLLGIFAEANGQGWALFRLASGAKLVAVGQEIAQGAQLVEVRRDGITIRDSGGERHIALRAEPASKAAPPATKVAAAAARNPACVPPTGFRGAVLRLNAELFQGIIAKPESWSAMVVPDQGALAVKDESGFVTMLAMKKGDRLLQANGVPLAAPGDVITAVLRPLAAQQQVRVMGTRDGQPREWLLLNAGTCPS
jgi:type II secretory pathway component PulC